MENNTKHLVMEMSAGVLIYGVLLMILAYPISLKLGFSYGPVGLGLLIGMLSDFFMLIHIAVIADRVMAYGDEHYANRTTMIHSMIRKVFFIGVIGVLWNVPQVNVLAIIIGAMGMKTGAYLQPIIHKIFTYRKDK